MTTSLRSPSRALSTDPRAHALLMASLLTVLANATISPALEGLEVRFADQPGAALLTRLLVPAPSIAVALLAPFAGIAADRFGRRGVLVGGLFLFAISGTAGLYLPDLNTILASRLVLGVAIAMVMTAQTALVGDCFEGEVRSVFIGWQISARNFGGLVFISAGAVLAGISAELPFAVYGVSALVIPLAWYAFAREPGAERTRAAISSGKPVAAEAWLAPVLSLTGLAVLTVAVFFMMPTQLPFFVSSLGFDSASTTGLGLGALTLTGGLVALTSARFKRMFGQVGTISLGYGVMAAGFTTLAFADTLSLLLFGTAAIGAGYALLMPGFSELLLIVSPAARRGTAAGVLTTGIFLGQFLSPFASMPGISGFGYGPVFATAAGLLAVLAIAGVLVALLKFQTGRFPREAD
jgi:MFS family permease